MCYITNKIPGVYVINYLNAIWIFLIHPSILAIFHFYPAFLYRGKYDSSITLAQKYHRSVSGYAVCDPIPSVKIII